MKKNKCFTFLLVIVVALGCKKNNDALTGFHITLMEGGDQTDTVAHALKMPVILVATFNGNPLGNAYVKINTYNCDNDPQSNLYYLSASPVYGDAGKTAYQWRLGGNTGKQILKAVLLDSLLVPRDSVEVSATAIAAVKGWNSSGCIPVSTVSNTFCKLPSGRILTGLRRADYPYYSDDNGASWHALKTFPNYYTITKMIATPANEIFLAAYGVGMYYSADGGMTWEKRSNGLFAPDFWAEIQYTVSGKLFVLTGSGIFTSPDKGLNWHQVTYGLSYYAGFSEAASNSAGTIYAIHDNGLVYSTDGGEGWRPVYTISSVPHVQSLFIDDNDDIYYSGLNSNYGVSLYVSKDQAQTWQMIYTATAPSGIQSSITLISKQQGYYYFYATEQNILMKTSNFSSYTIVNPSVPNNNGRNSFRYIIANNGEAVMSTEYFGIRYFLK